MNNPNPLVPQGSLLEQKSKSKPHLRVVLFIVAVHVVFFVGILIQGCKPEGSGSRLAGSAPTNDLSLPPLDTNNTLAPLPAPDTAAPPVAGAGAPAGAAPGGASPAGSASGTMPMAPLPQASPPVASTLPPATEPAAPAAGSTEYAVQKGDTLAIIAKKHGVSLKALEKANAGVDPRKLRISQKLQIPAPAAPRAAGATDATGGAGSLAAPPAADAGTTVYTVKSGDTLTKIAKAHGTTLKAIRAANGLKTDAIRPSQKLKLPARKAPAMSTEPPAAAATTPAESPAPIPAASPNVPGTLGGSAPR